MSANDGHTSAGRTFDSPLHISAVDVRLARESHKTIKSIELYQNDNQLRKVEKLEIRRNESHEEKFDPTLDTRDRIRASVRCNSRWGMRINVDIDVDLHDNGCKRNEGEMKCYYRKKRRNIEVVVSAQQTQQQSESSMPTSMTEIIQGCPRFRLLVMGNSGVGKSTLIHKVFGVEGVKPSKGIRGEAEIDREFTSPRNDRFVVHDSLGFEAGDKRHMEIVKEFVAKRKDMSRIKDQLHAIWLCLEIPYAGSRLLEKGVENLLRRRKEILGDIPLVVVLTKVDLLDEQLESELPKNETLEHYRSQYMKEYCIKPLQNAAGPDITHIAVSQDEDYAESLRELLKATMNKMTEYHVHEGPSAVAVVSQRISIQEKINLSIRMGKKKYWKTLMSSAVFHGRTMKECLKVIHEDIIAIWNFDDPNQCLTKDELIGALYTDIIAGWKQSSTTSSTNGPRFFSEQLREFLASENVMYIVPRFITRLATAVPNRVYRAYSKANEDAKILIAYIVHLICVMQIIFLLVSADGVTLETVTLALKAYESTGKSVHESIATLDGNMGVRPGGSDYVLEKIEELLWHYNIRDDQIEELRHKIPQVVLQASASAS